MSDIFLSCAIEDGVTAVKLAPIFRQQGWTVWWDASTITPGVDYLKAVVEELERAKIGIVLWSHAARESNLVRVALKRAGQVILVPVLLEKIELPFEFSVLQTVDLSDWDGAASHAELQSLLRRVRAHIGTSSPPAEPHASAADLTKLMLGNSLRIGKGHTDIAAEKTRADLPPEVGARFGGVFISYRRNEAAAYARGLYDRLAARFGRERVFFDAENVGWGEDFVEAITAAAESCAVMIVLVSRQWARGAGEKAEAHDYVRLEVAAALGRKVRVIPILIQGASMPAPMELPEDLSPLLRRNALALSDTRWERDVEDLIKTLESLIKD